MRPQTHSGNRLSTIVAAACVLALLLSGSMWWVTLGRSGTVITAYFEKTVGVYQGTDVRVLGIEVGEVDSVTPQGGRVKVDLTVDREVPVAKDVRAAIVAPNLVSDRFVQLTPAYDSGPTLASGTVLDRERTAVPVELDRLYSSVNKLSTTLGPNGANSDGALSDALDTAASNLSGNGETIGNTIRELGKAAKTLSNSRGDLFATVDNLAKFTKTLAGSEQEITAFSQRLADVSGYLSRDREKFGQAVRLLGSAMKDVHGFLSDNTSLVKSNVDKLADVTKVLVKQRGALAEVLDVAPVGLTNFLHTYDAASGAFSVRGALNTLAYPPAAMVCRVIKAGTPKQLPQIVGDLCERLAPVLDGTLKLPSVAEVLGALQKGELPPLPLPLVGQPMVSSPKDGG